MLQLQALETIVHIAINDAFSEWYKNRTKKLLNCQSDLPVLHLLQDHLKSGTMLVKLIDKILIKDLGFSTTTKDLCIYIKKTNKKLSFFAPD